MKFRNAGLILAIAFATSAQADVLSKGSVTTNVPDYRVADPTAPVVTEENLFQSERFWPYQTALSKTWKTVPSGDVGVLIRMESPTTARVDFGRDGLFEVPVGVTDLVERANAVRLGKAEKLAPNFVWSIGARLLDPTSEKPRAFSFGDVAKARVFLCVFADPWQKDFGNVVSGLAPLRDRSGLLVIFFPQSRRPNEQVNGQLRAMKWTPPYLWAHLSEPYTRTLIGEKPVLPAVLLQTADGRVLLQSRWSNAVVPKLATAASAFLAETDPSSSAAQAR